MRILFTAVPAVGHVFPTLPLARAAQAAGHDVRVGTGAGLENVVTAAGIPFERIGLPDLPSTVAAQPDLAGLTGMDRVRYMMGRVFPGPLATAVADDVVALATRWRPDVVIHDDMEMGGGPAAERVGVPHATLQTTAWRPIKLEITAPALGVLRSRLGLPPDPDGSRYHGDLFLSTRPAGLRAVAPPVPEPAAELRPSSDDDAQGATDVAWHRNGDRPRIAITLGTINNGRQDLFRAILDGLASLDADTIVALGDDPAALGTVPDNTRVVRWAPMSTLLRDASAVVFHGGSGTLLTALSAGVPLVILPIAADQHENAGHAAAAGVGRVIDSAEVTAERVRDAVEDVLHEPAWRDRARAIAAEIAAMPAPAAVVPRLEALIRDA